MGEFMRYTDPLYRPMWATDLVCDRLTRVARRVRGLTGPGTLDALMIHAPPQHFKSYLVGENFPCFVAAQMPRARIVGLSHNRALAKRAVQRVSGIAQTTAYGEISRVRVGRVASLDREGNETSMSSEARSEMLRFMIDQGGGLVDHGPGYYKAAGINSELTGWGFELGIGDDLVKGPAQAFSPAERANLESVVQSVFFTRRQENSAMVFVMTPWHPEDIGARVVEWWAKAGLNYEVLSLPACASDDVTLHPEDPRTPGSGEYLDLVRHTPAFYRAQRALVGDLFWQAMYQQSPRAFLGALVPKSVWPTYDPNDLHTGAASVVKMVMTIDPNEVEGGKSHAHISVWAIVNLRGRILAYKVDEMAGPWAYDTLRARTLLMLARWRACSDILIERAAMGPALIKDLEAAARERKEGRAWIVTPIIPRESKSIRAQACTPAILAGLVCLPARGLKQVTSEWVESHKRAWEQFPAGAQGDADRVDADGQFIRWALENRLIDLGATIGL